MCFARSVQGKVRIIIDDPMIFGRGMHFVMRFPAHLG